MVPAPPQLSVDYVEMYVEDLDAAADPWIRQYGFTVIGARESTGDRGLALRHREITLVLTQATSDVHPAWSYVRLHGDGVADIALRTDGVDAVFSAAVAAGAHPVARPTSHSGRGPIRTAAISGFGDVVHSLAERAPGDTLGLPSGFRSVTAARAPSTTDAGLVDIDHVAVCLNAGDLDHTTEFYRRALGFELIYSDLVELGRQAMASKVVRSACGQVTFTLLESAPDSEAGQIDMFLKDHNGPGVQHLAFSTPDAVRAVTSLSARGVGFLATPARYYDLLSSRITPGAHSLDDLRSTNLLVDEDHAGQMFQIFTSTTHPRRTLFFEIIERQGAGTFGNANIKALYEAVEIEGANRGA